MSFIEPSPTVYAYFFLQSFLFVPLVLVFALLRFGVARGPSRMMALMAMCLGLGVLFLQFGPALLSIYDGPLPVFAGQATRWGMGLVLPMVPSVALIISALVPGRRWWGLDLLHGLLLATLIGLFVWTRLL